MVNTKPYSCNRDYYSISPENRDFLVVLPMHLHRSCSYGIHNFLKNFKNLDLFAFRFINLYNLYCK